MGKKKKRDRKSVKNDKFFESMETSTKEFKAKNVVINSKSKSKISKKLKKKLLKQAEYDKHLEKQNPETRDVYGFHKVTIFFKSDKDIDKAFLIASIGNYVQGSFIPLGYYKGDDSITFYFDSNKEIADSIRKLNKKIQNPSGELMGIQVTFDEEIDLIPNINQLQVIHNVVKQRFNPSSALLNLSTFHLSPQLMETNTFAPLSNDRILNEVLGILKELTPEVTALDLSNNKLTSSNLKLFESLDCRSLAAINLETNNLKNTKFLKYLKFLPLKELKLVGNQFNLNNMSIGYMKSVKKELPFLKVIDGNELKVSIVDRVLEPSLDSIPSNSPLLRNRNVISEPSTTNMTEEKLKTFLEQYFNLIDTEQKETLLQAYVPTARIELKSHNPLVPSRVFEGVAQMQEFLQSWPATKHDASSFKLDILNLAPDKGVAQLTGVCVFCNSDLQLQFKRTMMVVPFNSGFCCSADLLEIV